MADRFHLIIEAAPDRLNRPADRRLAVFLKHASRAFGLRCVEVRRVSGDSFPADADQRPDLESPMQTPPLEPATPSPAPSGTRQTAENRR